MDAVSLGQSPAGQLMALVPMFIEASSAAERTELGGYLLESTKEFDGQIRSITEKSDQLLERFLQIKGKLPK